MFPPLDPKFLEQFNMTPASFMAKVAEFQRANMEAAREIAENNAKAFRQLAEARDPQAFLSIQPAILQAVVQRNTEILTALWTSLGQPNPPTPPATGRRRG